MEFFEFEFYHLKLRVLMGTGGVGGLRTGAGGIWVLVTWIEVGSGILLELKGLRFLGGEISAFRSRSKSRV